MHQRVGFPLLSLPSSLLDFVLYLPVDGVLLNTVLTQCTWIPEKGRRFLFRLCWKEISNPLTVAPSRLSDSKEDT